MCHARAEAERGKPSQSRNKLPPRIKHPVTLAQLRQGGKVDVEIRDVSVSVEIPAGARTNEKIYVKPQPELPLGAYVTLVQSGEVDPTAPNVRRINLTSGFGTAEEKARRFIQVQEALETLLAVKRAEDREKVPLAAQVLDTGKTAVAVSKLEKAMAHVAKIESNGDEGECAKSEG